MIWNWQQSGWPTFTWNAARLARSERRYSVLVGGIKAESPMYETAEPYQNPLFALCAKSLKKEKVS
jgi:hypothetical protein